MSESKDINPKDKIGVTKSPMCVVPMPAIHAIGLAMLEGALKYGRHNYRETEVKFSVLYSAIMRHMNDWWEGEDIDAESGLPHPIKAAACIVILFDAMLRENGIDDRPPKSPTGWLKVMNDHVKTLLAKYPDPKPPSTEIPL